MLARAKQVPQRRAGEDTRHTDRQTPRARRERGLAYDRYTMSNIEARSRMGLRANFQYRGFFLDVKMTKRWTVSSFGSFGVSACARLRVRYWAMDGTPPLAA